MNIPYHNPGAFASRDDDPACHAFDRAMDAIDCDPEDLQACVCRVVKTGAFDDLFRDDIKESAFARVAKDFVQAVRTEVQERAAENIWAAREYRREAREER